MALVILNSIIEFPNRQKTGLSKKWNGELRSEYRPKYVDHLRRWFRIFRSEETEMNRSIWISTEISGGIFGIMKSTVKDRTLFTTKGQLLGYRPKPSASVHNPYRDLDYYRVPHYNYIASRRAWSDLDRVRIRLQVSLFLVVATLRAALPWIRLVCIYGVTAFN